MSQPKNFDEYDERVLACVPTSLRARRGTHYVAGPEHTLTNCDRCETEVWIGPTQVEFKKDHPGTRVLCAECVYKEYPDTDKDIRKLNDD